MAYLTSSLLGLSYLGPSHTSLVSPAQLFFFFEGMEEEKWSGVFSINYLWRPRALSNDPKKKKSWAGDARLISYLLDDIQVSISDNTSHLDDVVSIYVETFSAMIIFITDMI